MSIYDNFQGYISHNYTDGKLPSMKLSKQDIPPIPFLWFRENHIRLEPYGLFKVSKKSFLNCVDKLREKVKSSGESKEKILSDDEDIQECTIQFYYDLEKDVRDVYKKSINNLYVSLHSWIYRLLYPLKDKEKEIIIPAKYKHNDKAQVKLIPIECVNLKEMGDKKHFLRFNEICEGSVHTHDASFSPPGHFCININRKANNSSDELNKPNIFILQCSYEDKTSTCLIVMATSIDTLDTYIEELKKFFE